MATHAPRPPDQCRHITQHKRPFFNLYVPVASRVASLPPPPPRRPGQVQGIRCPPALRRDGSGWLVLPGADPRHAVGRRHAPAAEASEPNLDTLGRLRPPLLHRDRLSGVLSPLLNRLSPHQTPERRTRRTRRTQPTPSTNSAALSPLLLLFEASFFLFQAVATAAVANSLPCCCCFRGPRFRTDSSTWRRRRVGSRPSWIASRMSSGSMSWASTSGAHGRHS